MGNLYLRFPHRRGDYSYMSVLFGYNFDFPTQAGIGPKFTDRGDRDAHFPITLWGLSVRGFSDA